MSVRSSSPAPNSSRTAVATSPMTSSPRSRPPPPVIVRVSDPMTSADEKLVAFHAGITPNSSPTQIAAPAQNATTRMSNVSVTVAGSSPRGISDGATSGWPRRPRMPSAPPISESTTLSVSSCRTMRRRPAPSADRTASSRMRTVARASSRLATLAQQMRSTKPTTPRNSIDVSRRSLPIIESCSGSSRTPRPLLVCGNSLREPGGDGAEIGFGSVDRHARLQASDGLQHVGAARARRKVDHRPHRPHAGLSEQLEVLRARCRRPSTAIRRGGSRGRSRSDRRCTACARTPRSARRRWRA